MVLGVLCWMMFHSMGYAVEKKNVLYLNSYGVGYEWSDDIAKGIEETLNATDEYRLYVEYMDTKRAVDHVYYEVLYQLYTNKYHNISFDVIITSDNNALRFLLQHYNDSLFAKLPVVFCGVSNVDEFDLPDYFYGVNENQIYQQELASILTVFPDRKIIYPVIDQTTTGDVFRSQLNDLQHILKGHVDIRILDKYNEKSARQMIDSLNRNGVIYFMAVNVDSDGNNVNPEDVVRTIARYAKIPIYGNAISQQRNYVVGGVIGNGKEHGISSALLAIDIMKGRLTKPQEDLVNPSVKFAFDYKLLNKWDIHRSQLPAGSIILNKPENKLEEFKNQLIGIAGLFILMVITIVFLARANVQRKKAEELVMEQLSEIEAKNKNIEYNNRNLRTLNNRLEELYHELLTTNEALNQAKEKAEEANKLKSAFLFNISHEIRTPMNSILGFLDILDDDSLAKDEREKYTKIIMSNANRLMLNVDHLLEYASIETGLVQLNNKTFSFLDALQEVEYNCEDLLSDKENTLNVDNQLAEGSEYVHLDEYKFKRTSEILLQTFNNLSKQNVIHLSIKTVSSKFFSLTYKMDHAGLSEKSIDELFTPFVQSEVRNEGKLEDVGLALAIARSYIEMMLGKVKVKSSKNDGICIQVFWPFCHSGEIKKEPIKSTP